MTSDPVLNLAEENALAVLTTNQVGEIHQAAPFYDSPWIRDSYAWGMIPDDEGTLSTYARGELSYWLGRQQPFGGWITNQYSGWYDETAILIAAVLDAYRQTGNISMVRTALPALRRAWQWLHTSYTSPQHGSSCLLWVTLRPRGPGYAADWADQVGRHGYTPQLEGLWYSATHAMAALESVSGHIQAAATYGRVADCIKEDINRLLWAHGVPAHDDALPLPPLGHYRARPVGRDYLEFDANALLAEEVAPTAYRALILAVIAQHPTYILGTAAPGPARVVYGDYNPSDYGPIHNWLAPGRYQSAYWPNVGGLLAMAAARDDDISLSMTILHSLAQRAQNAADAFDEWYSGNGSPGGATQYGWGARMYLLALYRAYLGVDDSTSVTHPADLVFRAAPGPGQGEIERLGMHLRIIGHGEGRVQAIRVNGRLLHTYRLSTTFLHNGGIIDVYRH
jgi:hypothetical protein